MFFQSIYFVSIEENNFVGVIVIKVSVNDIDMDLNVQIQYVFYSDVGFLFSINRIIGVINVIGVLDREIISDYLFRVLAVDGGKELKIGIVIVIVNIIDINDNKFKFIKFFFIFEVSELSDFYIYVGEVIVQDLDLGQNVYLQYFMFL